MNPSRSLWRTFCVFVATGGCVGFLPELAGRFMPCLASRKRMTGAGFFGTVLGGMVAWYFIPSGWLSLLWIITGFLIGWGVSHVAENSFDQKDDGRIVIDEIIGIWIATAWLPRTMGYFLSAFVLFRLLDVVKGPWGRWAERTFPGGLGVMLDDVLAGGITLMILLPFLYV